MHAVQQRGKVKKNSSILTKPGEGNEKWDSPEKMGWDVWSYQLQLLP